MSEILIELRNPIYEEYIDKIGNCSFYVDGLTGSVPYFIVVDNDHEKYYSIDLLETYYYPQPFANGRFETYDQKESLFSFLNKPEEYVHSKFRLVTTKWRVMLNRWIDNNTGKVYEMMHLLDLVPQPDYRGLIYDVPVDEDIYPLNVAWDIISGVDAHMDKDILYELMGGNASVISKIVAIIDGGDSVRYEQGSIEDIDYIDIPDEEPEPEPEEEDEGTILTRLIDNGAGPQYIIDEHGEQQWVTVEDGGHENYHVVASMYTINKSCSSSSSFISINTEAKITSYVTEPMLYTRTQYETTRYMSTTRGYNTNTTAITTTISNDTGTSSRTTSSSYIKSSKKNALKTVTELRRTKYYYTNSIPSYRTETEKVTSSTTSTWTQFENSSFFTSSYVGLVTNGTSYYKSNSTKSSSSTVTYMTTITISGNTVRKSDSSLKTGTYRTTGNYSALYTYRYIPTNSTTTTLSVNSTDVTWTGRYDSSSFTYTSSKGSSTESATAIVTSGFYTYMNNSPYTSYQTYHVTRTGKDIYTRNTTYTLTDRTSSTIMTSTYTESSAHTFTTNAANTFKITDTISSTRNTTSKFISYSTTNTLNKTYTSLSSSIITGETAMNLYSSINDTRTMYYILVSTSVTNVFTSVRSFTTYTTFNDIYTAASYNTSNSLSTTYTSTAITTSSGISYNFYSKTKKTTSEFKKAITDSTGSIYYSTGSTNTIIYFTASSKYSSTILKTSSVNTTGTYVTFNYVISNMTNTSTINYTNRATASIGNRPYVTTGITYSTSTTKYV